MVANFDGMCVPDIIVITYSVPGLIRAAARAARRTTPLGGMVSRSSKHLLMIAFFTFMAGRTDEGIWLRGGRCKKLLF